MSVFKPDDTQTCLIENLNVELQFKQNLLIIGRSSSGKTSLMRVLAQLWPNSSGKFQYQDQAYFMPQNPYLAQDDVTIRQQIGTVPRITREKFRERLQLTLAGSRFRQLNANVNYLVYLKFPLHCLFTIF